MKQSGGDAYQRRMKSPDRVYKTTSGQALRFKENEFTSLYYDVYLDGKRLGPIEKKKIWRTLNRYGIAVKGEKD